MILFIILIFLLLLSAFFSASETGLMGVNRYSIAHAAKQGDKNAKRIMSLLKKPDKSLSIILMGNTAANLVISSLATVIASQYFDAFGIMMATVGLTVIVLVFVEITPKTFAALNPEIICRWAALPLTWLLKLLGPIVFVLASIARGILWVFGVKHTSANWAEKLGKEELKSVIKSVSQADVNHEMVMGVINLNDICVSDVMLPRTGIVGVDIAKPWDQVLARLSHAHRLNLLVYDGVVDRPLGVLSVSKLFEVSMKSTLTKEELLSILSEVKFVPEGTSLMRQLKNFRNQDYNIAIVVDEFGRIQGMVSIEDIIEEIVGEYAQTSVLKLDQLKPNKDESYWLLGAMNIRDLNRSLGWSLPEDGPNTINGLILETLEIIPEGNLCLKIGRYRVEIIRMRKNRIELIKLWPPKLL